MKTGIIKMNIIKTAIASVLCSLILTSCWEDFNNEIKGSSGTSPEVKTADCQLTTAGITLNWTEPDAVAYTGMKIIITDGTTTTETTVLRGTTTSGLITYAGSGENTIKVVAQYSTGYEIESLNFKVIPPTSDKTLRLINSAEELAAINTDSTSLGCYYILTADMDLSDNSSGTGWTPIGKAGSAFTGVFDGNGHTISNLTINDSASNYKGFFGCTTGAEIKNLTLTNVSVNGNLLVGGLAGQSNAGTISNCSVTGTVSGGRDSVGGLVGMKMGGTGCTVKNCTASVTVISTSESAGGLIGHCEGTAITDCHATGSVKGTSSVGGLVGYAGNSTSITNCFATGDVLIEASVGNEANAGGLVGLASLVTGQKIEKCYALGNVTVRYPGTTNNAHAGGLVGWMRSYGSSVNCFARGNVDAKITSGSTYPVYAGGLVGRLMVAAQYCYSTGSVAASTAGTGTVYINGFAVASGTLTACYYNTDTTGRTDTGTGYNPLTTSQMQNFANYTGWSASIWSISSSINDGYPYLTGMVP